MYKRIYVMESAHNVHSSFLCCSWSVTVFIYSTRCIFHIGYAAVDTALCWKMARLYLA